MLYFSRMATTWKGGAEKTVYLVRHGQSELNVAPIFQGLESPLSQKGQEQAQYLAERFTNITFDTLIASPLERARQTATVIGQTTGKTPEYSELFVECKKPTVIHNKSYEDTEASIIWKNWQKSLFEFGPKVLDGETFEELVQRADQALHFLQSRTEQSLVVVTHGLFLRVMLARALHGELLTAPLFEDFQKNMETQNTGITVLHYKAAFEQESAWRLWTYNDHAHLG